MKVQKIFYKGEEVKKILDYDGNIVFQKTAEMTNDIKYHTTSSVDGVKYFTVYYTDSTQSDMKYSEPNKEYTFPIPTDKTVRMINFGTSYIDEVTLSCKMKLSSSFFNARPSKCRLLTCDSTESTDLAQAFKYINSVEVRNLDARNASGMTSLFGEASDVKSIVMRGLNVSKVTNMSYLCYHCSGATTIDIANWDTSSVSDLESAFSYCSKVGSLDLSSWNTINVTSMTRMFESCSGLASLDVSHFDTSKVRNMAYMFQSCSSLTSLDLSSWRPTSVSNMDSMFDGCSGLISLNLSGWGQLDKYCELSYMFRKCSSLTSLDISGWDISSIGWRYMNYVFNGCSSLKTIYMRGCNSSTISKINSLLSDAKISSQVTIVTE